MYIKTVKITNYKCFETPFTLELEKGMNILVGDNGAGKSTIIEAINLALTGTINGRYIKNEIHQDLFNINCIKKYLKAIQENKNTDLPEISIEIFLSDCKDALLSGNFNSEKTTSESGFVFKILFDEEYEKEYHEMLKDKKSITGLPIEFYTTELKTFARDKITQRSVPIKTNFIDISLHRYQSASDLYLNNIIKNKLNEEEKLKIIQVYRGLSENFSVSEHIKSINKKLEDGIQIQMDFPTKSMWDNFLVPYQNGIPFSQIGQGAQSIIKTKIALCGKKTDDEDNSIVLIEEPENHLSHTKLNELIEEINRNTPAKQTIMTSHSSFVANKLGLENLILLSRNDLPQTIRLNDLDKDTYKFFKKIPGFPTLRLLLSKKAVLVEGSSDELIFQKAYMEKNNGKLPIMDGIDVISVDGLSFERYLQIAEKLNHPTCVITDNDGNYECNISKKYRHYMENTENNSIQIFADKRNDLNTLEPQLIEANKDNKDFSSIFCGIDDEEALKIYMKNNKAECALRIFETDKTIIFPKYINDAVDWCMKK